MNTALTIQLPKQPGTIEISGKWQDKRDVLLAEASELPAKIESQEDFELGSEWLRNATKHAKTLEKERKALTAPFLKAQRAIKAACDEASAKLLVVKGEINPRLDAYATEQRRRQAEERRRIEEEERARAEEQMAAADELGLDAEDAVIPETPSPEPTVQQAESQDARVRSTIMWEVVHIGQVPRAFLSLDERCVNDYVRERKDEIRAAIEAGKSIDWIPGIRIFEKVSTVSR